MPISIEDIVAAAIEVREDEAAEKAARSRKVPTSTVVHLYVDQHQTISQIAKATGLHRATVYRRLTDAKAYTGPGKSGPPRKERCVHGHSLAEWGREKQRGGGRFCLKCKREQDREGSKRRYQRNKGRA